MGDRVFAIDLTPTGITSCVLLDGVDISALLRGIVIRSNVHDGTTIELVPAPGAAAAQLQVVLPEARVFILTNPEKKEEPDDRRAGFA